jgi:hypothetical protein
MVQFKQKCAKCKVNYVTVTGRNSYGAMCYECQSKEMQGDITDPEMQKMFNIDEEYYKTNPFLRSIKINYLKYGKLSERQVEAFKESVERMRVKEKKQEEKAEKETSMPTTDVSMRSMRLAKKAAKEAAKKKQ